MLTRDSVCLCLVCLSVACRSLAAPNYTNTAQPYGRDDIKLHSVAAQVLKRKLERKRIPETTCSALQHDQSRCVAQNASIEERRTAGAVAAHPTYRQCDFENR